MTDVLINLVREKKNILFWQTQKHFIFHRERASPAKHLSSVLLCLRLAALFVMPVRAGAA